MALPTAYCVKCKEKVEIAEAKVTMMKNGRLSTQGKCPTCETRVFRIGT